MIGIPDFLQMDNDLAFWGSLKVPGAVGKVIRLCLLLSVIPIFIPPAEPWRNGVVEHFNNTMQDALLKTTYQNITELRKSAAHFDQIHNRTHHYSTQGGMTPTKAFQQLGYPFQALDPSFSMPREKLPLKTGEIHVIRFVRSDLKFNVFGLIYNLPAEAKYEYIKGTILVDEYRLIIHKDQERLAEFHFPLM